MLFQCHICAKDGTVATFNARGELQHHMNMHLNTLTEKAIEFSLNKDRQISNDIYILSSSQGSTNVNGIGKTTEVRSNSTSQATGQTNHATAVKSKDPACSTSSAKTSSVKSTDLNHVDTSEVEVLCEIEGRTRKRQRQPSDLAPKTKSKPEEIVELSEEDIVIVECKEAMPKTIPVKKKVTFMEKETNMRPISAPKHTATMYAEEARAQVSAENRETQSQTTNIPEWTKKSGNGLAVMEMMKNMGWVHGKGLGVKKQGIVEPIKAKGNRGRAGLGVVKHAVPNPSQPTAPLTSQIEKMLTQSATRISVNGIGLSSTSLQKHSNYLLTYFRQFGAVEKIDFDSQGAIITFKNPAEADICLQQDQHTIRGIDCEVKRAEAAIPKVSILQLLHSHSHHPLPPPTLIDNTAVLSQTRITVKGFCSSSTKLQKAALQIYFGNFGSIEQVQFHSQCATITFKSPSSADVCLQQSTHTINAINCEVERAKATKNEKKKMREALQKNLPTTAIQPGPSRATAHATPHLSLPCPQPTQSNSITVSGLCLQSSFNALETKAYYSPYFAQFGIVTSVIRKSGSEATVTFQDSAAVENALRRGTIKFDGKDCKITRLPASTATMSGKKQEKSKIGTRRNQSEATKRAVQQMPYTFPFDGRDSFNPDFNNYGTPAAHGYGEYWGQPNPAGMYARPTYSDRPLPYNQTYPPHQIPQNGHAMFPCNGHAFNTNSYGYQAAGPSTSYQAPGLPTRYLAPGPPIYY
ncbi:g-patch domain-containing protein [Ditylenchus destructor]|uniref:G-patch domain-containing protein n=1 Tax=Ditylenchus destructor TaxID=166010 RepID=A0AAD4MRW3_9BILA|nr:g-patch domain-containing protein [Ditylenchus destructor]